MDRNKMNVLIIDDNVYKTMKIKRALEYCGIRNFLMTDNVETALEILKENAIDITVTDMHYPLAKGEIADYEAGFKFIECLRKEKIGTPVIICSSLRFVEPDVLGTVWYNELSDIDEDFKKLIDQL